MHRGRSPAALADVAVVIVAAARHNGLRFLVIADSTPTTDQKEAAAEHATLFETDFDWKQLGERGSRPVTPASPPPPAVRQEEQATPQQLWNHVVAQVSCTVPEVVPFGPNSLERLQHDEQQRHDDNDYIATPELLQENYDLRQENQDLRQQNHELNGNAMKAAAVKEHANLSFSLMKNVALQAGLEVPVLTAKVRTGIATIELLEVQNQLQEHEIERLSPKAMNSTKTSLINELLTAASEDPGLVAILDSVIDDLDDHEVAAAVERLVVHTTAAGPEVRRLDSLLDAVLDDADDEEFFSAARVSACQKPFAVPIRGLVELATSSSRPRGRGLELAASACRRELKEMFISAVFAVSLSVYAAVAIVVIPAAFFAGIFGSSVPERELGFCWKVLELEPKPQPEPEIEDSGFTLWLQSLAISVQQMVDYLSDTAY